MEASRTRRLLYLALAVAGAVILFLAGALWQMRTGGTQPQAAALAVPAPTAAQPAQAAVAAQSATASEPQASRASKNTVEQFNAAGADPAASKGKGFNSGAEQAGEPALVHDSPAAGKPEAASTGKVFINGRELRPEQLRELQMIYGVAAPPGEYWYDTRSGLFGRFGYEAAGVMRPGHDFGHLPENASHGHTAVFVNGRQINEAEARFYELVFRSPRRLGRFWMDGNLSIGMEGSPVPFANVVQAIQAAQGGSGGKQRRSILSSHDLTGVWTASDGNCGYAATGAGSVGACQ